jgi:hypothetical protein
MQSNQSDGKTLNSFNYQVSLWGEPSCFNIYKFSEYGIRFAAWYHNLLRTICEEKAREYVQRSGFRHYLTIRLGGKGKGKVVHVLN